MQGSSKRASVLIFVLGIAGPAALLVDFIGPPARADEAKGKGYLPGLGDLMNASMQVHHTKLWFAGHADNWALAAYELKEIKETIEDIESFSPEWQGVPVGEMVKSLDPNLTALDQAIKAKNPVKFDTAYHQLTEGCNTCHAGANHPEIKIIEPIPQGGGTFADQDFTTGESQ
jgi:hypothetical protein